MQKRGFEDFGSFFGRVWWRKCVPDCLDDRECCPSYRTGAGFWSQTNLAVSALWHKMKVLDPPESVVEELQRKLIDFFWDGQHWKKSAVLIPIQKRGQGLMDIKNRIKTFRLQAAERLLCAEPCRADTARAVLRKIHVFKYDVHLFLIKLVNMDLKNVSPLNKVVLRAWTSVFKVKRVLSNIGLWRENEPLFNKPLIPAQALEPRSIQNVMARANC